jgi:acyl dehydratase
VTQTIRAYEDFTEGMTLPFGTVKVTADDIVRFASQFDPQPMHLDEEAGRASLLGGLAASGWHTCSIFMRLAYEAFLKHSTSQGGPGISELSWKRPVLAGDELSGSSTVLSKRVLRSRPNVGLVTFRHVLTNQRGETVLELENPILFALREPEAGAAP